MELREIRRKEKALSLEHLEAELRNAQVGRLGTIGPDGFPYIIPLHFLYDAGKIYIHSARQGNKITNLMQNVQVCFEVDRMTDLLFDANPCEISTAYDSVVAFGEARFIETAMEKQRILQKIVEKYAPHSGIVTEAATAAVAVVEITIQTISGKRSG